MRDGKEPLRAWRIDRGVLAVADPVPDLLPRSFAQQPARVAELVVEGELLKLVWGLTVGIEPASGEMAVPQVAPDVVVVEQKTLIPHAVPAEIAGQRRPRAVRRQTGKEHQESEERREEEDETESGAPIAQRQPPRGGQRQGHKEEQASEQGQEREDVSGPVAGREAEAGPAIAGQARQSEGYQSAA